MFSPGFVPPLAFPMRHLDRGPLSAACAVSGIILRRSPGGRSCSVSHGQGKYSSTPRIRGCRPAFARRASFAIIAAALSVAACADSTAPARPALPVRPAFDAAPPGAPQPPGTCTYDIPVPATNTTSNGKVNVVEIPCPLSRRQLIHIRVEGTITLGLNPAVESGWGPEVVAKATKVGQVAGPRGLIPSGDTIPSTELRVYLGFYGPSVGSVSYDLMSASSRALALRRSSSTRA